MALTDTQAATTEAAAVSFTLSGPTKFAAILDANDQATIYEDRGVTTPTFLPYKQDGQALKLTYDRPSINFEGYGDYKVVISRAGIEVGYVA